MIEEYRFPIDRTEVLKGSQKGSDSNNNSSSQPTSISTENSLNAIVTRPAAASEKRPRKPRKTNSGVLPSANTINYRGITIYQAAEQGNLPLCVLLWGMASAKRLNLVVPDANGNNPLHLAAVANTPEVVSFLIQQTRGMLNDEVKLVDSRNAFGETPLLRTMITGNIAVVKALIDEGSDPLVTDYNGSSVFTILAKTGHIWCLNYMFNTISNMHGPQVAVELMSSVDLEGRNPLDWAAEAGNINLLEFFIRRGLNPFRLDVMQRSCLFYAVKARRVDATRFLVSCGCDIRQLDVNEQSPLSIASSLPEKDKPLLRALIAPQPKRYKPLSEADYAELMQSDPHCAYSILYHPPSSSSSSGSNTTRQLQQHDHQQSGASPRRSKAIERKNYPSKKYTMLFAMIVFALWLCAVFFPVFIALGVYLLAYISYRQIIKHYSLHPTARGNGVKRLLMEGIEGGLGLWVGCMIVYGIYLLSAYFAYSHSHHNNNQIERGGWLGVLDFVHIYPKNLFHLRGLRGSEDIPWLLWAAAIAYFTSILQWFKLVWISADPGIVDNRITDFEEALAQSFVTAAEPHRSSFCHTSMVKKPLRSKYCVYTGCVVARMDHYCMWLCTTIAYRNHRSFILFLMLHLALAISGGLLIVRGLYLDLHGQSACETVASLVSRPYFVPVLLTGVTVALGIFVAALLYDQLLNIATNLTTNERVNQTRYSWLKVSEGEPGQGPRGTVMTRFNRGICSNIFEFLQVPGFAVDYRTVFDLPAELTHENMVLNTNRLASIRLNGMHSAYSGQLQSGPPSLDLEMGATGMAKQRTDSVDSSSDAGVSNDGG